MADLEKVMNGLKCCAEDVNEFGDCLSNDCPYKHKQACCSAMARDALELLKAQEAVPPGKTETWNGITYASCGYCGNAVMKQYSYCPFCGRKVAWND